MKYTFIETGVAVVNGELVEQNGIERTYNFSLKMNGLRLFELEYGKPLIKALNNLLKTMDIDKLQSLTNKSSPSELLDASGGVIDGDLIHALASATYVKIDGNTAYNNEETVEEFKNSFAYYECANDVNFITKLLNMAIDNVYQKTPSQSQDNRKSKN